MRQIDAIKLPIEWYFDICLSGLSVLHGFIKSMIAISIEIHTFCSVVPNLKEIVGNCLSWEEEEERQPSSRVAIMSFK